MKKLYDEHEIHSDEALEISEKTEVFVNSIIDEYPDCPIREVTREIMSNVPRVEAMRIIKRRTAR